MHTFLFLEKLLTPSEPNLHPMHMKCHHNPMCLNRSKRISIMETTMASSLRKFQEVCINLEKQTGPHTSSEKTKLFQVVSLMPSPTVRSEYTNIASKQNSVVISSSSSEKIQVMHWQIFTRIKQKGI